MEELEVKTEEEMRKMSSDFIEIRSRQLRKKVDEPDRKGAPHCWETEKGTDQIVDWEKQ